jgi:transcriptional regulator with XRE-family HTH domain/quercetin dioxygenase-like cupin family protein
VPLAGGNPENGGKRMKTLYIGQRVQKLLADRQMDTAALAQRTGLDIAFLESLLADDVYPSIGPLLKVARALGVRLGTLIDDRISQDPLIVRRTGRSAELHMLRAKDRPQTMRFHSLGRGKTDRHMEPFYVELLPESADTPRLSAHEGEEWFVVEAGEVQVIYGRETCRLGPGDSIYYNSVVPHYVSCAGPEPAAIYAVLYIPE